MRYRGIVKWIVYSLVFLAFLLLQTGVLARVRVWGVSPNILPTVVAVVAMSEGRTAGAVYGFFIGLWCDAVIPPVPAVHAVLFLLLGAGIGHVTEKLFRKNFLTGFLCSLVALAAFDVVFFVVLYLIPGRAALHNLVLVAAPEIALTALCVPAVYVSLRAVARRFGNELTGETS
ncbi:MAG: rod shape-determining protein MreD [Oscillospiraceae bacterium]|nr:rod shape-determining protein MreD [Oscillospiraceae bacterium]